MALLANNNLNSAIFQATFANRVPGVSLFTKDLNCHCINQSKDFVLNPAAWVDPAAGQFGTSAAYYGDYRTNAARLENFVGAGRKFQITERVNVSIRAEFNNIFNRTELPNPTVSTKLTHR